MTYAKNQKKFLNAFLEHGEVDISNNLAENAIRPFVQGRKAWLFCDTPKGADSSAIVYSIVETAKANGLDPYTYLKLLLTELPYLGKNRLPTSWICSCRGLLRSARTVSFPQKRFHPRTSDARSSGVFFLLGDY